jgi:hypothetical protein
MDGPPRSRADDQPSDCGVDPAPNAPQGLPACSHDTSDDTRRVEAGSTEQGRAKRRQMEQARAQGGPVRTAHDVQGHANRGGVGGGAGWPMRRLQGQAAWARGAARYLHVGDARVNRGLRQQRIRVNVCREALASLAAVDKRVTKHKVDAREEARDDENEGQKREEHARAKLDQL